MNSEYTGKQIAELRKSKNLTQKELASKLHITDKAVSKWERGMNFPDLGLMEELAKALDTTPSKLLGLEDSSKEEIMTSLTELSNTQSQEAEKDIQKIGWLNLFCGILLLIFTNFCDSSAIIPFIYGLSGVVIIGALYTLRKYKAIKKWELLDVALTEILVCDIIIFFSIQLFTGHNPHYLWIIFSLILGSICLQLLFYRVMKPHFVKILPVFISIFLMIWGMMLYASSAAWRDAGLDNLLLYFIPFISCLITYLIYRKIDKENILPYFPWKSFAIGIVVIILFTGIFGQELLTKTYVKLFHPHMERYAEKLLNESDYTIYDQYGPWDVSCYPESNLVEFRTGGSGLVTNSTYWGIYYSPDNTHKVFQDSDYPLNVNKDLADWYGEGDNWGKSIRLFENWFWFEASL